MKTGAADAVRTMAPDLEDKWKPVPVLVTKAEGMAPCRGMHMGYAPLCWRCWSRHVSWATNGWRQGKSDSVFDVAAVAAAQRFLSADLPDVW